ncbi:MAG TPA: alpha/beta hydrolase [Myxococcales bacterium]|nr:alpha/beta hydrolase [Myxococcales bacterium]
MTALDQPVSLSILQRLSVILLRGMMRLLGPLARLRRSPAPPQPTSNYAYGAHREETLEYFPPPKGAPNRAPVVYIHGGGWIMGKKELYSPELVFLAEAGYPVFNLEYPLAPETPHPGILRALLGALSWIETTFPQYPSVHLMGDSAGGNLALMLGILCSNPEQMNGLEVEVNRRPTLSALSVVSLYGVLDRLSWIRNGFPGASLMLQSYAGKAAFEETVGPRLAITPMDLSFERCPPTFLAAASKDPLAESSSLCREKFLAERHAVTYMLYEGENHGFFNRSKRPATQQLKADVLDFLTNHELTSAERPLPSAQVA